jgi:hypothetical protein
MRWLAALVGSVLGLTLVSACATTTPIAPMTSTPSPATGQPAEPSPPGVASPRPAEATATPARIEARSLRQRECPQLEGVLADLIDAPDPAAFATRSALRYEDGRVYVVVQLRASEGDLDRDFDLRVTGRASQGQFIEAYAPLTRLCELSNDARVWRVAPVPELLNPKPEKP